MACGGSNTTTSQPAQTEVQANDIIANIVIENTLPASRRHALVIRAGERTVATELHKFVNPEKPGAQAEGIKCWAMVDPQDSRYRIRILCRGEAKNSSGEPAGLVAEGIIYCPSAVSQPSNLELRVSEQSTGDVNPDEQYLPVVRVACVQ